MYGNADATPFAGDWDNEGRDNLGVRMGNVLYFRTNPSLGGTPETTFANAYGYGDEYIVIGDWNNDGFDTPGVGR